MLVELHLPASFWSEALFTFLYVGNRSPTSSLPSKHTPYELWFGKKPDLSHLKVFGCRAYVHVQKDKRGGKLGWHMMPCIFIGYPDDFKGWRFWDPAARKVIVSE